MNLRETLLATAKLNEREAELFGQKLIIRELTGKERYAMGQMGGSSLESRGLAAMTMLIKCLLDPETHKPVFELADLDTLMGMSGAATDVLVTTLYQISGLAPTAQADAEKNSQPAKEASSSSSPSPSTEPLLS